MQYNNEAEATLLSKIDLCLTNNTISLFNTLSTLDTYIDTHYQIAPKFLTNSTILRRKEH